MLLIEALLKTWERNYKLGKKPKLQKKVKVCDFIITFILY